MKDAVRVVNADGTELPDVTDIVIRVPLHGVVTAEIESVVRNEAGDVVIVDDAKGRPIEIRKRTMYDVSRIVVSPNEREIVVARKVCRCY